MKVSNDIVEMINSLDEHISSDELTFIENYARGVLNLSTTTDVEKAVAATFLKLKGLLDLNNSKSATDIVSEYNKFRDGIISEDEYREKIGKKKQHTTLITGTHGCGLSTYMLKIAISYVSQGISVYYFENDMDEQWIAETIKNEIGIDDISELKQYEDNFHLISAPIYNLDELINYINTTKPHVVFVDMSSCRAKDKFVNNVKLMCPSVEQLYITAFESMAFNGINITQNQLHFLAQTIIRLTRPTVSDDGTKLIGHYKYLKNIDEFDNNLYLDEGDIVLRKLK